MGFRFREQFRLSLPPSECADARRVLLINLKMYLMAMLFLADSDSFLAKRSQYSIVKTGLLDLHHARVWGPHRWARCNPPTLLGGRRIGMDARNCQSILYQRCHRLESERTAETVRRILPELLKLHSCESRAACATRQSAPSIRRFNSHVDLQWNHRG